MLIGHGVANLGHANPRVAEAIYKQASTLIRLFETFPNDKRAAVMEKLCALVPGLDRVFLCNSGTEAVEAAFKFARLTTGRKNIVAAMRASTGARTVRSRRPITKNIARASNRWRKYVEPLSVRLFFRVEKSFPGFSILDILGTFDNMCLGDEFAPEVEEQIRKIIWQDTSQV